MNNKILNTCKVISSELGAKGFFYPKRDSDQLLFVQRGAEVKILNFTIGDENSNLQAVAISNSLIEGANSQDGVSVYWVDRKNVG